MIAVPKIALLFLALVPAEVTGNCVNDRDYTIEFEGRDRPCSNIRLKEPRRQELCGLQEVQDACPHSCGTCCEDTDGFEFTRDNKMTADCAWLAEKPNRIARYCDDITKGFPTTTQGTVRDGCSATCSYCFEPVALATVSPAPSETLSGAPSGSPSGVPTGGPSAVPTGMPSPTPTEEPTRPPSPMPSPFPTLRPTSSPSQSPSDVPSTQPSDQPSMQPSKQPSDQPSMQPSDQPSMQPSKQPSDQPSMQPSDQPSDQPSMQPSDQPSMQPSDQPSMQPSSSPSDQPSQLPSLSPSDQPSNNPTMSIKPSPLPSAAPAVTDPPTDAPVASACENDSAFTFTLINEGTDQGCGWITDHKRVAIRQNRYCGDAAILAACPQACGTCIADDPDFTFQLKKQRGIVGCEWITRNTNKVDIRMKYCERANVAAGCAATCESYSP